MSLPAETTPPWMSTLRWAAPGALLVVAVLAVAGMGLVVLYSAGLARPESGSLYVAKQAVWLVLGLATMVVAAVVPLGWVRSLSPWIYGSLLLLLVLVLHPALGTEVNGSRRWFDLGPLSFQVSDGVRIALLVYLAHFLDTHTREVRTRFWRGFVAPMALIGVPAVLVILQPDFGTAFLLGLVGVTLFFLAGARLRYLAPTGLAALSAFALAIYHDPVRLRRITAFLDVEAHEQGAGYQLMQGLIGFATGGLFGVGLGNGRQQRTFLPEAHTDFVFPVLGEELGLVFTGLTVLLFGAIFLLVVLRLRTAPHRFAFLLVSGALLFITCQALINLGVVTGLLPTKGMSLPLLSYGGSNMLATFALVGLILNCFREWERPVWGRAREL